METITFEDSKLLREILSKWDELSNLEDGESGLNLMTDHCHDLYDGGLALAEKLERISAPRK